MPGTHIPFFRGQIVAPSWASGSGPRGYVTAQSVLVTNRTPAGRTSMFAMLDLGSADYPRVYRPRLGPAGPRKEKRKKKPATNIAEKAILAGTVMSLRESFEI